jgi:hypothetical protein
VTAVEPRAVESGRVSAVMGAAAPAARDVNLVVARLHLRLGSLSIARAELETFAGRDALDAEGILDLAEVRWRTGDLAGAGEAAVARLETAPDDVLALVIAAEAQADLGRPSEARRLAGLALSRSEEPIDTIFAGMPRSAVWPIDPGASPEPAGELFEDLPRPVGGHLFAPAFPIADIAEAPERSGAPTGREAYGPGLWEDHADTIAPVLPDATELLARSRTALDAARPGQAAAGLALALRAEPSLAPTILDLLAGRQEPVLALVRGDANRIVGHEAEALRDYATAVAAIDLQRRSDDRPPEPDEARPSRSSRRRKSHAADSHAADSPASEPPAPDSHAADSPPLESPATDTDNAAPGDQGAPDENA